MKIKAYILINQKSISEFPYLEKDEILNKTKQIDNRTSKEKLPRPVSSNEEIQKLAKNRLDRVSREDMQNYFGVTTENFKYKPLIMEIKPTSHPSAFDMCKQIVSYLQSHYLGKSDLKAKYWLIDFIESSEGITYFLQIKAFDGTQKKKINKPQVMNIPRTLRQDDNRRKALRSSGIVTTIEKLKNEGIYNQNGRGEVGLFCAGFDGKELEQVMDFLFHFSGLKVFKGNTKIYKSQIESYIIQLNYFAEKYNLIRINPFYPLFELARLPPQGYEPVEVAPPVSILKRPDTTESPNKTNANRSKRGTNSIK